MNDSDFVSTDDQLKQIAEDVLKYAREKGASALPWASVKAVVCL